MVRVFEVGRRVEIMVDWGGEHRAYLSRIEGIGDRAILAAMPMERRMFVPLAATLPVELRLSLGWGQYCLKTTVLGCRYRPVPVVLLDRRGELRRLEQRRAPRVAVFIKPLESLLAQDYTWRELEMTILNISAGGFLFVGGRVANGSLVRARFELPRFGQLSAISKVVWGEVHPPTANRTGACFMNLSDRDKDRVSRFVLRHQMEMRGKGLGR